MKPHLIALLSIFIVSCSSAPSKQEQHPSEETLGHKLAYIEFNQSTIDHDSYVTKLDSMINLLSKRYHEPKDSIAEYTQRCNSVLNNEQIPETNLDLMIGVNNMGEIPNTKYKEVIVLLAVMLKGSTHNSNKR